jgi:hypothetical protein
MAIRFHFGEHEHTDIVAQPVIFGQSGSCDSSAQIQSSLR